jgi:hypothetical protein
VCTACTRGGLHPVGYVETSRVPMFATVELKYDRALPIFLSHSPEISAPLRR